MPRYVALLRGINVGGRHRLVMADLRGLPADAGLTDVSTHLQSGNAVFSSTRRSAARLAATIADGIDDHAGFRPGVQVLTAADFVTIATADPYADEVPRRRHVVFLAGPPAAGASEAVETLRAPSERVTFGERAVYLHAPDGVARSKLVASLDRALGTSATARNARTVAALVDRLDG